MEYLLNILDFLERITLVVIMFLIFFKIRRMDKEILKSVTYLRFDTIRNALNFVMILSPFFLAASVLEYPGFAQRYGEEQVHFIQDIMLIFFQTGVIYFFAIVYKALNLLRH